MARLDRLLASKEVAQRAAVLGREFEYPLLAATAGLDDAALRQGLARLVEAEILFARGDPATYTFKHALIQETAYQSLLKRARQQFHARIAQVLETSFPERVASEPEVTARHYDEAGLTGPAIAHYHRAGERATRRSANEEAIGHLRRALALVETLAETRERHQQELTLQMALGMPLAAVRGWSHPEYEQTFLRARELASHIGDSPELPQVLVGLGASYYLKGDVVTAAEVAQAALAAAERTGNAVDLLGAHLLLGQALSHLGDLSQALQHLEQAIKLYDSCQAGSQAFAAETDPGVAARSLSAACYWEFGYPDRGLAMSDAAVALAKRVEHPISLALALFDAAVFHAERGELDRTRQHTEELATLAAQFGFPLYKGAARFLRGLALVEVGEVARLGGDPAGECRGGWDRDRGWNAPLSRGTRRGSPQSRLL